MVNSKRQNNKKDDIENEINLSKKDLFLKKLQSKKGYKRYVKSPLRYGGGKTLAVGKILEYFPKDIKKVVSPFIGGGSIEVALAKELGIKVIAYDIFELIVNYWKVQISQPKELYEELSRLKNTKDEYERVKNILKKIWNKKDGLLKNDYSDLELANYYYYNHNKWIILFN